ncbi:podocan-like [Anthonomus grandis grandis]|uniref:podocan-like n=1 Tax=Anthonomus grandis grandis TaxID=2921223 RepID=UPI0021655749|nr:podocan-like [Anthonomus grandis grandis]
MLQLLILLMSVLITTSGSKCPAMCTCKHLPRETVSTNYLYYISARCNGFNSSERLSNVTRELKVFNLDETSVNELFRTLSVNDLRELRTLVITHSVVNSINVALRDIRSLTLSHNNLTKIPQISERMNLTLLDLSSNNLTELSFINLTASISALESLNLNNNFIRKVNNDTLSNFRLLKVLDISQNQLYTLNDNSFRALENLQFLNLSYNKLQVLQRAYFSSLNNLQQLDVSWNNLARVALGSLQLPSLSRLLLAGNSQLGDSYELLLGIGQRVQIVDVSKTGLKKIPAAITHSIKSLKLLNNTIKTLSRGELDDYPLLQYLDLSSNDIVSLEDDAMGRLEFLSNIHLTNNKIVFIPRSLPESLRELHLGHNNIVNVLRFDLKNLPKLEVLILNDNKIITIESDSFTMLKSLITLDLSGNSIKSLYPGSFPEPSSLQILRLSGIDTVSPATDVSFPFSSTDNLISLDLSNSPGLARQFIEDTAALASSRELQELDISGADLKHIRSDLLHFLPQLRVLHLKDNRLNCTDLEWLALWMRRQVQAEHKYITCASPPELWGMSLLDLESPSVTTINTVKSEQIQIDSKTQNFDLKNSSLIFSKTENSSFINNYFFDKNFSFKRNTSLYNESNRKGNKTVHSILLKRKQSPVSSIINDGGKTHGKSIGISNMQQEKTQDYTTSDGDGSLLSKEGMRSDRNLLVPRQNETSKQILIKSPIPVRTPHERKFNDTFGLTEPDNSGKEMQILGAVNLTDNVSEWNVSTVKTSMIKNSYESTNFLHPGMLIVAAGLLGGTIIIFVLLMRLNKKRFLNTHDPEVIPVTSIASVSDLW